MEDAKENIANNQVKQKETQNKEHNIQEYALRVGTKVMINNDGIIS